MQHSESYNGTSLQRKKLLILFSSTSAKSEAQSLCLLDIIYCHHYIKLRNRSFCKVKTVDYGAHKQNLNQKAQSDLTLFSELLIVNYYYSYFPPHFVRQHFFRDAQPLEVIIHFHLFLILSTINQCSVQFNYNFKGIPSHHHLV